ncbi:hypothetical protein [Marinobacterium stanieri]|nr:hypothetical protein [Marinobacterium stanieri]
MTDLTESDLNARYAGRWRIKNNSYFYSRMATALSDLGLSSAAPHDQLTLLQDVYGWTLQAQRSYGFAYDRFSARLVERAAPAKTPQKRLKSVQSQAAQRFCQLAPSRSTPFFVYVPPTMLFRALSTKPYPIGQFRYCETVDYLDLESTMPKTAFVLITNNQVLEQLMLLPHHRYAPRRTEQGLWLALPEYQQACTELGYSLPCDHSIVAKQHSTLGAEVPLSQVAGVEMGKRLIREQVSYSLFLLFDAILGSRLGVSTPHLSFSEIYLSALARMALVEHVKAFQKLGFSLSGYGVNRIGFESHPLALSLNDRSAFINTLDQSRLLMPVTDLQVQYQERQGDHYSMLMAMLSSGNTQSVIELNHHILATE